MPLKTGTGRGGARPGSGRPKGAKNKLTQATKAGLWELAMNAAPDALQTLIEVASDKKAPPAARISAATSILDRALGKPTQSVEHSGPDGEPIPFDGFDLTVVGHASQSAGD